MNALIRSAVAVVLLVTSAAHGSAAETLGRVTDVTLYRGQALVTRSIPVEGPAGELEIVVGQLPEQIIPDSLFAEGNQEIEIRAVRFRARATGEEPREEVRRIDEEIEHLQRELAAFAKRQELLAKRSNYLDHLEGFVAPTAKTELSKGVLDAEALERVTLFSFNQRNEIAMQQLELQNETKKLQEELVLLHRKRNEVTAGASKTVREAVLFLHKDTPGNATVRLNYLVSACGWSPTYTFRANGDLTRVGAECSGLIRQMTGEDWQNVNLTLSTASPALSAAGPGLAPFPVLLSEEAQKKLSGRELASRLEGIRGRQSGALRRNLNALSLGDNIASSWEINSAANGYQWLELTNDKDALGSMDATAEPDGPSLSYRLAGKVSLASRDDQQMVRILQADFQADFYHVATPVLTSQVYREAELKNTADNDLLAGPITVYLDGRFVGRGELPTVARGQKFIVGFGADPQLRAQRELAERKDSVQGGNRELSFQYRLVVENFKDKPTKVRLFDRLPYSDRPGDVRVTLSDLEDPLSDDNFYERTERPKGILRWDIEVPANAADDEARIVEYGYIIEFDRNFALRTIGGPQQDDALAEPAPAEAIQEFEMQQRARLTK